MQVFIILNRSYGISHVIFITLCELSLMAISYLIFFKRKQIELLVSTANSVSVLHFRLVQ